MTKMLEDLDEVVRRPWHAPGIGEVRSEDDHYEIYCTKEDESGQQIADDDLAIHVRDALNSHATITDMVKRLEAAERDASACRAKMLDYADRLERGEPWMHKGAKFTKWIKEVVSDMREWTEGGGVMHKCNRCGYLISELEWESLKFSLRCPRCRDNSFARVPDRRTPENE